MSKCHCQLETRTKPLIYFWRGRGFASAVSEITGSLKDSTAIKYIDLPSIVGRPNDILMLVGSLQTAYSKCPPAALMKLPQRYCFINNNVPLSKSAQIACRNISHLRNVGRFDHVTFVHLHKSLDKFMNLLGNGHQSFVHIFSVAIASCKIVLFGSDDCNFCFIPII